jgi:hypothetical protein
METVPSDTAAPPPDGFLPIPETGRVFTGSCPIRRTEVTPGGRLRFDALTRYLQDVAEDDLAESGWTRRHRSGTGRCGPATSTPPGTSATPFTGRRRRR